MPFATHEEIAKAAAKMFNERMQGKGPPVVAGILMRFAARKAHELTVQLLAARPKREAA